MYLNSSRWLENLVPGPLKLTLALRADSEHEHATVRLLLVLAVLGYLAAMTAAGRTDLADIRPALWVSALHVALIVLHLLAIIVRPQVSSLRRSLAIAIDMLGVTAVLWLAGTTALPVAALLVWVPLENGMRYGLPYLLGAAGASIMSGLLVGVAPAWTGQGGVLAALLLSLLAASTYLSRLLNKLQHAAEVAEHANRSKARLLANMGHELRMPINGVVGMTDLLLDSRLSEEQKELGRNVQASARRLQQSVDRLLDLGAIESDHLRADSVEFDLHRLVNDTMRMFSAGARRKGLQFATHIAPETPFLLEGDALHLRQVLINVIGNAIRFTPDGSVDIRVAPVAVTDHDALLRFEITDSGPGLPPGVADSYGGRSGAPRWASGSFAPAQGVYITRELVRLMGGRIDVNSDAAGGTRIRIELPFDVQPVQPSSASNQILPGTRVLLLLGPDVGPAAEKALAGWSVACDRVENCPQLFSRLLEPGNPGDDRYTAVLIDHSLLDMHPTQMVRALHAESSLQPLSLVLLTNDATLSVSACLTAGYSSVLRLPLDKTLLFNALHAARSETRTADNVVSLAEHYRSRNGARHLRVLLGESDDTQRRMLEESLRQAGHDVTSVVDGEQALDVLSGDARRFDLLVMSMQLPLRDGVEVLKTMRFLEFDERHLPALLLTEPGAVDLDRVCDEVGADLHLTKPIEPQRLLDAVARLAPADNEPARPAPPVREGKEVRSTTTALVVNENKLDSLARLGSGVEFVRELVGGFQRDGERLLAELEAAVSASDYRRYRDVLHAFRGSGSELGCQYLVAECQAAGDLKPYEMGGSRPMEILARINAAYARTCEVLGNYVNSRRDAK